MHNGHAAPSGQEPPADAHLMQLHRILQNPFFYTEVHLAVTQKDDE